VSVSESLLDTLVDLEVEVMFINMNLNNLNNLWKIIFDTIALQRFGQFYLPAV
jgi:hypothetical protein